MYLNPEDGENGLAQKKRQFSSVNQHYITHNAVIAPFDLESYKNSKAAQTPY